MLKAYRLKGCLINFPDKQYICEDAILIKCPNYILETIVEYRADGRYNVFFPDTEQTEEGLLENRTLDVDCVYSGMEEIKDKEFLKKIEKILKKDSSGYNIVCGIKDGKIV